jgi:hypothetical protein
VKSPLPWLTKGQSVVEWDLRRNDIDTSVLHGIPSLLSDGLGGLFELLLGSLTVPVRLDDLSINILLLARSFSSRRSTRSGTRHTFFMARFSPILGKPRTADLTIVIDGIICV